MFISGFIIIKAHKWKGWHPRPVLIVCDKNMEKDGQEVSHRFDMEPDLVTRAICRKEGQLVYVVTEPPTPEYAWCHDRWPRLLEMVDNEGL